MFSTSPGDGENTSQRRTVDNDSSFVVSGSAESSHVSVENGGVRGGGSADGVAPVGDIDRGGNERGENDGVSDSSFENDTDPSGNDGGTDGVGNKAFGGSGDGNGGIGGSDSDDFRGSDVVRSISPRSISPLAGLDPRPSFTAVPLGSTISLPCALKKRSNSDSKTKGNIGGGGGGNGGGKRHKSGDTLYQHNDVIARGK